MYRNRSAHTTWSFTDSFPLVWASSNSSLLSVVTSLPVGKLRQLEISLVVELSSASVMIFYGIFGEYAFNLDLNPVSIPDHSSMIYLCTGVVLNWDNRIHCIRPPLIMVQRTFHTHSAKLLRVVRPHVWELGLEVGNRQLFSEQLYLTHLQCIHILYLLTLFSEIILNPTIFFKSLYCKRVIRSINQAL